MAILENNIPFPGVRDVLIFTVYFIILQNISQYISRFLASTPTHPPKIFLRTAISRHGMAGMTGIMVCVWRDLGHLVMAQHEAGVSRILGRAF